MKNESPEPGPGRSTSQAAFSALVRDIARQNDAAQTAARKRRAARDSADRLRRQAWERGAGLPPV
jgi:hypothetical protein